MAWLVIYLLHTYIHMCTYIYIYTGSLDIDAELTLVNKNCWVHEACVDMSHLSAHVHGHYIMMAIGVHL